MLGVTLLAAIGFGALAAAVALAITVTGAVVGLLFRGAALAWRDERDAAVEKAERLEKQVGEQAAQIDKQAARIETLEAKVTDLIGRPNYEVLVAEIRELDKSIKANTAAVELLGKRRLIDEALDERGT